MELRQQPTAERSLALAARAAERVERSVRSRTVERTAAGLLMSCAMLLAAFWVFRMPMFLAPDEVAHADGAFAYFDAGGPFRIARATRESFVTPQVRYLMRSTGYRRTRYNADAAAPRGYGTAAYFRRVDEAAPGPAGGPPVVGAAIPYVLTYYPAPYYALVALAMRAGWGAFGHSLSAAFFCGRLFNVVLLGLTLITAYATLIEARFGMVQRLLLLAGLAFFPMSLWMSASIQPDNLSALLVTASLLAALRLRKHPSLATLLALGLAGSALGLTKIQYAVVTLVAISVAVRGVLRRQAGAERLRTVLIAGVLPLLVIVAGRYVSPVGRLLGPTSGGFERLGWLERLRLVGRHIVDATIDATLGGRIFRGFWFHFGIRSEAAFAGSAMTIVTVLLVVATALAFVAWSARQLGIARRLRRVATRHGPARALAFVGTDPALNLYAGVSLMLVSAYAFSGPELSLQGRYWYPVLLPILIVSVRAFGAAVPRTSARLATTVACACWAGYAALSAPLAVAALDRSYYHASQIVPASEIGSVEAITVDGRPVAGGTAVRVIAGQQLAVAGSALDTSTGLPATDVRYRLDDGRARRARSRLADTRLASLYYDPLLARSGFAFRLATTGLALGPHRLSIVACESRAPQGIPVARIGFVLLSASTQR